jgi:hypothetical protein
VNAKTAKKLRKQAYKLALHTYLAADAQNRDLKHANTGRRIYRDLKNGKLK